MDQIINFLESVEIPNLQALYLPWTVGNTQEFREFTQIRFPALRRLHWQPDHLNVYDLRSWVAAPLLYQLTHLRFTCRYGTQIENWWLRDYFQLRQRQPLLLNHLTLKSRLLPPFFRDLQTGKFPHLSNLAVAWQDGKVHLNRFVSNPQIKQLRILQLQGKFLDIGSLEPLWHSGPWPELIELTLSGECLSNYSTIPFAQLNSFPKLQRLTLPGWPPTQVEAAAWLRSPFPEQLECLHLKPRPITATMQPASPETIKQLFRHGRGHLQANYYWSS